MPSDDPSVQSCSIQTPPIGGTFRLMIGRCVSAPLPHDVDPAVVDEIIDTLITEERRLRLEEQSIGDP